MPIHARQYHAKYHGRGEQMGIYLRLAPGVKVRLSSAVPASASGRAGLRLWAGVGGKGVSTGASPVSVYRPLRRRGLGRMSGKSLLHAPRIESSTLSLAARRPSSVSSG
jgi:hypothetical protein